MEVQEYNGMEVQYKNWKILAEWPTQTRQHLKALIKS